MCSSLRIAAAWALVLCFSVEVLLAQKKSRRKKGEEEEITQVLELPKDPPMAVQAEPQRLTFLVAPLSSKGLLSQQVKDGLRTLRSLAHGGAVIKIRAFVAGTGDVRRVPAIVSEQFTDWKLTVPAVTAIRVGALPMEGAQVALEALVADRKVVNPHGLAFFSGQQVTSKEATEKVAPLFEESLRRLAVAAEAAQVPPDAMLRVTCFSSALGDYSAQRQKLAERFPKAAVTVVQNLRGLSAGLVECEGVGRLSAAPGQPVETLNPRGLAESPHYSQVVRVNTPRLVISGSQQCFQGQETDVRLAFDRLDKAIEPAGGSLRRAVFTSYYPLTQDIVDKIRRVRFEFLDQSRPPASTLLLFEGLPSMDATFAMEVVTIP